MLSSLSEVIFIFPLFQLHSYITMPPPPKKNRKQKLPEIKIKLQNDFFFLGGGEGVTGGRELMLVHKIFTFVQAILSTNLLEGTLCRPGVFCRLQNAECRT